ncbi:fibroblast growth factor 22 isoform X4 [Dromaius novaehollandiae]|uniref:fibroblast growth factor 22 isoform X4 n=1 Tax=Dromaius novaehollandiae TaxID=8790 RepID=UPI00311E4FBF
MAPSLRLLSHPSSPRGRSRHPRPRRVRAQEPGGVPAQAVLPCARRHHGDPVGTRRRRGHPSGAHRLLPGHEPAGEALRLEGVQPQLRVRGAHRGERLQQLRVAALAPPGPPHVPLARQPGQAPARARDAAPAPLHPLPPPARRLSPAPGQPALGVETERTEVEANALDPACSHAGTWHCWDAALPHPAEQSRHGAARAARSPLRQLPSSRLRLQQPNRAGVVLPTASLQGPGRGEAQRREGTETAGPGRAGRLRLSCVQALAEIKATFTLQKGERVWELRLLGLARVATGPFSTIAASSDSPGVAVAATGIGPGPGPGHPRPNLPPGSTGVAFPAAQSREQGEGRGSPGFAGRGWVEAHA